LAPVLHEAEIGWAWEPSVLLGLALASLLYGAAAGPVMAARRSGSRSARWQAVSFYAGLLAIFVALVSPLDALADGYLFSAHMAQHLLLMMGAVPLMMIGLPSWMYARLFARGWPRRALGWLTRPVPAFLIFNLTLGAWHLPRLYGLALENEGLHILQHLMLLAAAGIGWWPVLGNMPGAAPRPSRGVQVMYLFLQGFPSTALAALITLAPNPLYGFYAAAPRVADISAQADQMWSGLLMWMPGAMVYLMAATAVFFRWFGEDEATRADPATAALTATGEVMHG
jgi:putative membrane protein